MYQAISSLSCLVSGITVLTASVASLLTLNRVVLICWLFIFTPLCSSTEKIHPSEEMADDPRARTPLMRAVRDGTLAQSQDLLNTGANVNVRTASYRSPLMFATHRGDLDILKLLLNSGADIDAAAANGWTTLMLANVNGQKKVL